MVSLTAAAIDSASSESVRVICRIRPENSKEKEKNLGLCVKLGKNTVQLLTQSEETFAFDAVFGPDSTQQQVFSDAALPLVNDILGGYNGTIFAYGQTSSGKTHTMEGVISDPDLCGIIPRVIDSLFNAVEAADENIEFQFMVNYVEIYMEKIRDLLDDNRVRVNLSVREDKLKGVYIAGAEDEYVASVEDMLNVMAKGARNRSVAATGMNEGSSRSHSVFTIKVAQRNVADGTKTEGKLVLVDLAGSEMVRKTNASGQQLEEAKTINKSLSAIGQVINALTDDKISHVPYRDSKLTRVLQDSLGGNSKTALIIACSPSMFNAPETQSTLKFGMRAKRIKNTVSINQTRSVEELEALLLRAERAIDTQQAQILSMQTTLRNAGITEGIPDAPTPVEGEEGTEATSSPGDAALISNLKNTIQELTNELEEEREESKRNSEEVVGLNDVVKEKERLLIEAGELMLEAQKHYESQKSRADQLSREKIDVTSNLENIRSQLQDELSRTKFEVQELTVTIDSMKSENSKLVDELAELSGDAPIKSGLGVNNDNSSDNNNANSPFHKSSSNNNLSSPQGVQRRASLQYSKSDLHGSGSNLTSSIEVIHEESLKALEDSKNDLDKLLVSSGVAAPIADNIKKFIVDRLQYTMNNADTHASKNVELQRFGEKAEKRINEIEIQRAKLTDDLRAMTLKCGGLQVKLDVLRQGEMDEEDELDRDQMYTRSLQQRLEQLVAVHRQLLRRFASLEIESSDSRKKILLRDERIKQLEGNSRGLSASVRQQAEKHATELTSLRQQILELRAEHMQRLEMRALERETSQNKGPKIVRGKGGGHKQSGTPPDNGKKSVFGRIFGH